MSQFSFINEAFQGNLIPNETNNNRLTFDVIKTCGKNFGFVTIEFSNANNKLEKYEWEVCPQSSTSSEKINKGIVTDTTVNSFVFPISNDCSDYFVQVKPYYNVVEAEWKERNFHPFHPESENSSNNGVVSEETQKTDKLFGIFYTSKIMGVKEQKEFVPSCEDTVKRQEYYVDIIPSTSRCKNPSLQTRKEPKNPNVVVSPWLQSSYSEGTTTPEITMTKISSPNQNEFNHIEQSFNEMPLNENKLQFGGISLGKPSFGKPSFGEPSFGESSFKRRKLHIHGAPSPLSTSPSPFDPFLAHTTKSKPSEVSGKDKHDFSEQRVDYSDILKELESESFLQSAEQILSILSGNSKKDNPNTPPNTPSNNTTPIITDIISNLIKNVDLSLIFDKIINAKNESDAVDDETESPSSTEDEFYCSESEASEASETSEASEVNETSETNEASEESERIKDIKRKVEAKLFPSFIKED